MTTLLEKAKLTLHPKFIEGSYDPATRTADVVIITEGLGNKRDKNFYLAETLREAAANKVFEGGQAYADHPSRFDEANRPERSVRDLIGYYYDCRYDPAQSGIVAKFKVQEGCDWVEGLIKEAIDYQRRFPGKTYVGISINADGDTEPGIIEGEKVNLVRKITEAFSADTVTKPARGGRFLKFVEGANGALQEYKSMTLLEAAEAVSKLTEGESVDKEALVNIAKALKEADGSAKCANGACGHAQSSHDGNGCNAQDCECQAFKAASKEAKAQNDGDADDQMTEAERQAKNGKLTETMSAADLKAKFPSLFQAAFKEAQKLEAADKEQLKQRVQTLEAAEVMRESIALATSKVAKSKLPKTAHELVITDLVGLSESEMDDKLKYWEKFTESFASPSGSKISGAGPSQLNFRESDGDVKANTAALMEGVI